MIIGVPREIKNHEYRVGLLPVHVEQLTARGHRILVEGHAGEGSGATDADYRAAGARLASAVEIWDQAALVVKVKEPQPVEVKRIRRGQVVFTYFHFAAEPKLLQGFVRSGGVAVAYETIQLVDGTLPLLTPMSEIAGRMAVHEGAKYLEKPVQGRGLLLAGVPGVEPATVVVLGAGVVGFNAAKMAAGLGAVVWVLDVNLPRLRYLDDVMPANVHTLMSNPENIRRLVREADLLIGAVLIPGAKTPRLVSKKLVAEMKPGAVIVDVGVDQGGCVETIRPTTHERPTYLVHEVVHYAVTNMPGAVARTSTKALTNATYPYVQLLADQGWEKAAAQNGALAKGLNVVSGKIVLDNLKSAR
jgi:alanine dehydrogenase